MILTFNTSDNANVIIIAVQKAAYGIDLSSATRVYFVSPVWQTAMEQQAIKRAHRIGQTKPVYIETLVIRNTIEDELLKRREQVSNSNDEIQAAAQDRENLKRGDFFADSKLRNILNHARFVPLPACVYKNKETGEYQQKIVPLDVPLEFVPNKKEEPTKETQEATLMEPMPLLSNSTKQQQWEEEGYDSSIFSINVDDNDQLLMETQNRTFTNASDVIDYFEQSSSNSSEEQDDDDSDIILDIEGDMDVMDNIQPWKVRLMDQQKQDKSKKKTSHKRKYPKSPSPTAEDPSTSLPPPLEKNKKKKKTVSFV